MGGRLATGHLVELGHQRFGLITAPARNVDAPDRLAGAREALRDAGMPSDDESSSRSTRPSVIGGERAAAQILGATRRVTAIVAYNDLMAIGAMRAVRRRGPARPADVSVVGFDDVDLAAYVDPPLTTIAQATAEMGRWAVERADRRARPIRATDAASNGECRAEPRRRGRRQPPTSSSRSGSWSAARRGRRRADGLTPAATVAQPRPAAARARDGLGHPRPDRVPERDAEHPRALEDERRGRGGEQQVEPLARSARRRAAARSGPRRGPPGTRRRRRSDRRVVARDRRVVAQLERRVAVAGAPWTTSPPRSPWVTASDGTAPEQAVERRPSWRRRIDVVARQPDEVGPAG